MINIFGVELENPKREELDLLELEELLGLYYSYTLQKEEAEKSKSEDALDRVQVAVRMMARIVKKLRTLLLEWSPKLEDVIEERSALEVALEAYNKVSGGAEKNS